MCVCVRACVPACVREGKREREREEDTDRHKHKKTQTVFDGLLGARYLGTAATLLLYIDFCTLAVVYAMFVTNMIMCQNRIIIT